MDWALIVEVAKVESCQVDREYQARAQDVHPGPNLGMWVDMADRRHIFGIK